MIYIIGTGSHADVVYDILFVTYPHEPIEFLYYDDKTYMIPTCSRTANYICGVGDNFTRKKIVERHKNLNWINAIHPTAILSREVKMGIGNVIGAGCVLQIGTRIGNHSIINTNSSVDHHCVVKNYVHLAPNVTLCGRVTVHDGVFVGVSASIVPNITLKPWMFVKAHGLVKKCESMIQIYKPQIYHKSITAALDSGWISSQGEYIGKAEQKLSEILGCKHVILLMNGTCATHCLFLALKWKYPEIQKIYVPNNCYVAAYNSALYEYPLESLEVMGISNDTLNIEEKEIMSLEEHSAVLIVHNVGNIVNVPVLKKLRPDLIFLEDNCEGFLGEYEGKMSGTASECSSLSFFANKTVTCGEGGAFCTNDSALAKYIYSVTHQGQTRLRYLHDKLAYNYRITNLQAALLYDHLCDLDRIRKRKLEIFEKYVEYLEGTVCFPCEIEGCKNAYWMICIRGAKPVDLYFFEQNGIEIRPFFWDAQSHEHLATIKGENIVNPLNEYWFMLPSHPDLSDKEIFHVCSIVKNYFQK
jgi:perosamine synthetase